MNTAITALVALLDRERLLLELVTFKLVELRQLLASGETRFLGWATEELERALAHVRAIELERAVLTASLAPGEAEPDLSRLIELAPEPQREALVAAQSALRASSSEIAALLDWTGRLAADGSAALADLLGRLSDGPGAAPSRGAGQTYGRDGWAPPARSPYVSQAI